MQEPPCNQEEEAIRQMRKDYAGAAKKKYIHNEVHSTTEERSVRQRSMAIIDLCPRARNGMQNLLDILTLMGEGGPLHYH